MLSLTEMREHARALRGATPDTVLRWAVVTFPRKVTLTVSFGGGGVVLAHLISRIDRTVPDVLGHPVPFPGDVRLQGAVRQAVRPQSRRAAPADRPRTTVPDRPRPLLLD